MIAIPLVNVDLGLAADESGVTATATSDGSQGEDDLLATIDVGVEDTKNVLEARLLRNVQRPRIKEDEVSITYKSDGWTGIRWDRQSIERDSTLSDEDPCKTGQFYYNFKRLNLFECMTTMMHCQLNKGILC